MLGKKTDGLILDVDGTLVGFYRDRGAGVDQAVRDSGFPDFEVTADGLKRLFGKTMEVIAEEMLPWLAKEKRESIMERLLRYEHRALEEDECRICYPGVTDTIRQLSKRLPVFIVSNCQSGYIELFLEKTGLGEYVTDIECYGNTKCGKGEKYPDGRRTESSAESGLCRRHKRRSERCKRGRSFFYLCFLRIRGRRKCGDRDFLFFGSGRTGRGGRESMKRIIWMVLMNLWYVPYGIYHLLRMSSHPERYSLERAVRHDQKNR